MIVFTNVLANHGTMFLGIICGGFLIFGGFYMFSDTKQILLSRLLVSTNEQLNSLSQPLFYYVAFGIAVAGTIAILASIMGFWASILNTYCFLTLYFLAVAILLLAESVVCLTLTLWPKCLGISLEESQIVKALQQNYGVPGKEQFTIAMDLAQTKFRCCGMDSENNYDTSTWRLQGHGIHNSIVPLTCCFLSNNHDPLSYLDPKPINESQCQALPVVEYSKYRHTKSCFEYVDTWYREQFVMFLCAILLIIIIEFFVMLSIILNCTKMSKRPCSEEDLNEMSTRITKPNQPQVENVYAPDIENKRISPRGRARKEETTTSTDFKEVYIQPQDLLKCRHSTNFKPARSQYHISTRSYFV
ncbi:uncharacterized protein LOC129950980 isoform X2 [Eupeodes corollae]|uniref:uncharacterized protein LOC129950980 isoform X2 n=1 Tax=Eupeodes corollae TaxID=290404 RepID=UPI00249232B6|nr:uncharacterized protein LOC129950980 isoform X2 [Eupeodes corollae]